MVIPPLPSGCPLRCMSLGSQPSLSLSATAKNGHSRARMPSRPCGLALARSVGAPPDRTPNIATSHESGYPSLRDSCSLAAPCVRFQHAVCVPPRAQPCKSHTADPPTAAPCRSSGLQTSRWLGRKMAAPPLCARPQRMHGCVRDSSAVTRWASTAHHRRSNHGGSSLVVPGAEAAMSTLPFRPAPSNGQHVTHP